MNNYYLTGGNTTDHYIRANRARVFPPQCRSVYWSVWWERRHWNANVGCRRAVAVRSSSRSSSLFYYRVVSSLFGWQTPFAGLQGRRRVWSRAENEGNKLTIDDFRGNHAEGVVRGGCQLWDFYQRIFLFSFSLKKYRYMLEIYLLCWYW